MIQLLMLLMVMPGLACGPFMGLAKAQAAQMSSMPGMEDCEDMGVEGQNKAPNGSHIFFKDCAKTDLHGTSHTSLEKPDLGGKVFFAAWAAATPDHSFAPAGFHAIRGPPPDWPDLSKTHPAILLTTQRIRE